jgi:predicted HicB family RNase H-like nuclease
METVQLTTKEQDVVRLANEMFEQGPDWVTFFREVLGLDGIVRKAFYTPEELANFEQTCEYDEIQKMLANLRARGDHFGDSREPTRVITVRLPKSLHESLRAEAHERHTSMNKLCISKLLQMVETELVPTDA